MEAAKPDWQSSRTCTDIEIDPRLIGTSPINIGDIPQCIWPANQSLQTVGDPKIIGTYFPDHPAYHSQLITSMLASANASSPNVRGLGGKKIRSAEIWMQNAFRLMSLRVMLMFCKAYGQGHAYLADRWGNVLEQGDYSVSHCHFESVASAVYFVDLGDQANDFSGKFELIDPRIEFCCPRETHRPSRGLIPNVIPGTLLMFPSEYLHHVHPYFGARPRLTIAWNIAAGTRPPNQPASQMEAQVNPTMGSTRSPKN